MNVRRLALDDPTLTRPRRRVFRPKPALFGSVIVASLVIVSSATLPWSLRWHDAQSLGRAVRHGPSFTPVVERDVYLAPFESSGWRKGVASTLHRASSWLGHDELGRSLLFRVCLGTAISLAIGLGATAAAALFGTAWGMMAGLSGGRVDGVMMRIVDVLYGLPYILTVILMKVALTAPLKRLTGGGTPWTDALILLPAIGLVSWPTMARVVRGQVLSLREEPFIEAARVLGAGPTRILLGHLAPNLIGPVVVYATLAAPQAILQEAFLSFLGIGVPAPLPSLGRLCSDGITAVNTFVSFWWLLVFPCGVLVSLLLSANFLGDALRDALDPKSSQDSFI